MSRTLVSFALWLPAGALLAQTSPLAGDLRRAAENLSENGDRLYSEQEQDAARAAAVAYRDGRFDEAVEAYDRAAAEAFRSGALGLVFDYAVSAAEIQRSRRQWADASARFRRAALGAAQDEARAAVAHDTACQALAELVRSPEAGPALIDQYDALLAEHTVTWPRAPTAEPAVWRRVELLAQRGDWDRLVEATRRVEPASPRHGRSRELLVLAHSGRVEAEGGFEARLVDAADDLLPIILGEQQGWPTEWSPLKREAALVLARGHLRRGEEGVGYATPLLRVALRGAPPPEAPWAQRAASLLAVYRLVEGDHATAEQTLVDWFDRPRDERRRLLTDTATGLARGDPRDWHHEADRLHEALTSQPAASPTDAASDPAIETLRLEAQRNPDDREAQVRYAVQLEKRPAQSDRRRALSLWSEIEKRSPRPSDPWYEARLARLRLLLLLGEREKGAKLAKLTRLLAPPPADPRHQQELDELVLRFAEQRDAPRPRKPNPGLKRPGPG